MLRFFLFLVLVPTLHAVDVAGKWRGDLKRDGKSVRIWLTLKQQDDGTSGLMSFNSDPKAFPIENPKMNGDQLSFDVSDAEGRLMSYRLTILNGSLRGEVTIDGVATPIALRNMAISPPTLIRKVNPTYSKEARKAGIEGTVVLTVEVNRDGLAQNIKVVRSLGMGLDEKAIEAVRKWKFKPGEKDGRPVVVAATIEVHFRLRL